MAVAPPRSDFVELVLPPYERLDNYDPSRKYSEQDDSATTDLTKKIPQTFLDAMAVRQEVFVEEQGVPLANEFDDDDRRSFHWVAYASMPCTTRPEAAANNPDVVSTRVPIGTIRLVPAPNPPPHTHTSAESTDNTTNPAPTANDKPASKSPNTPLHESYVKLGRLAVIRDFRKNGIATLLIRRALDYIATHPTDVRLQLAPAEREEYLQKHAVQEFAGLCLVHAQVDVQKYWAKFGFERDESLGEWDEEGIMHVGMWKRIDVSKAKD